MKTIRVNNVFVVILPIRAFLYTTFRKRVLVVFLGRKEQNK
jgi:hypothetical protein